MKGSRHDWSWWALAAFLLTLELGCNTALADSPTVRRVSAPLVAPDDAWLYYTTNTTHTNGPSTWTVRAPELQALARGLGSELIASGHITADQYADRVAAYIRNNIEVEFRFGLGKGSRGAVIDQSGTSFDQAQLMVDLLREASQSASYQGGTITLNAQQFGQWTGLITNLVQATPPALPGFTVSAQSACQFLADGGIPALVNGQSTCAAVSGNLTSVQMGHIWVLSNGRVYDPSFKRYNLRTGINLAAAMGCGTDSTPTCGSAARAIAIPQASVGIYGTSPTLRNLDEYNLHVRMATYATALQTYVETNNLWDAPVEDLIGGRVIDETYQVPATLPYTLNMRFAWSGDIPDRYRTTLRIRFRSLNFLSYADEIYGRRISMGPGSLGVAGGFALYIDDEVKAVDSAPANQTLSPWPTETTVDHPYAAQGGAYGDETTPWAVVGAVDWQYVVVHLDTVLFSLGNTGSGMLSQLADREHATPSLGVWWGDVMGAYEVRPGPSIIKDAQLLYQQSLAMRLVEGVSRTRVTQHHAVGSRSTYDSVVSMGAQYSVDAYDGDTAKAAAAFESLAVSGSMLEGSLAQQQSNGWRPGTTGTIISDHNRKSNSFVDIAPAELSAVFSLQHNYDWPTLNGMAAEGYNMIVPVANLINNDFELIEGGTYVFQTHGMLAYRSDAVANWVGPYAKGGASSPSITDPTGDAMKSVELSKQGLRDRKSFVVDLASGNLKITAPPDLTTGAGSFPYALPIQRTYQSTNNYNNHLPASSPWWASGYVYPSDYTGADQKNYYGSDSNSTARLGGGWSHNYQITANLGNDGAAGLGANRGVDALGIIAGLYTINDLNRTTVTSSDPAARAVSFGNRLVTELASNWLAMNMMGNVVDVQRPPNATRFVRLPNGQFRAPSGSNEQLSVSGPVRGPLCAGAVPEFFNHCTGTTFDYSALSLALTDSEGSILNLSTGHWTTGFAFVGNWTLVTDPKFTARSWSFPSGVQLTFNYTTPVQGNFLSSVTNNLGRALTFAYTGIGTTRPTTRVADETGQHYVSYEANCTPSDPNPDYWGKWGSGPYGCRGFEVVTADGQRTIYSYESVNTPDPVLPVRPDYRLRRWFTPEDLTTPYMTVEYDDLYRVKALVDKNDNRTRYFISGLVGNENQKRGDVMDAVGAVSTQYFNRFGKVSSSIDPLGRETWNTYDDRQRLKQTIAPEGNSVEYAYDVRGNVLTETKRPKTNSTWLPLQIVNTYLEGPTVAICADQRTCNKLASTKDYKGRTSDFSYNSLGQLTQILGPTLGSARAESDYCYSTPPGVSLLTGRIDVVGNGKPNRVTKFEYITNKYVLYKGRVDPTDSLTYSAATKLCSGATKSDGQNLTTTFAFDGYGNVQTVDGPRAGNADTTTYTFDAVRRIKQVDAPLGQSTIYTYFSDGSLQYTDRIEMVGTTPVTRREERTYYPTGELQSVKDPEGNVTSYAYDATGRQNVVTNADGHSVATVFDFAGQTKCVWKGWNGNPTLNVWTQANQTPCAWNPADYAAAGNNGAYRYVTYDYSLNGKQIKVTDGNNNITDSVYDGFDRPRYTMFPAPTGATAGQRCSTPASETISPAPTCPSGATYEEFYYSTLNSGDPITAQTSNPSSYLCDGKDQACRKRNRRAQFIAYTYDAMNRVSTKVATSLPTVTYAYNLMSEPLSLTSPSQSSPTVIPAHNVTYDYNDVGRKLFERNTLNGVARQVSYGYDAAGNRTSTTWPDTYLVSYEYDDANRMSKVWEGQPSTGIKLADYTYDTLSRRQSLQYAGQTTNRVNYTYEADSNLDVLTNVLNATTVTLNYDHNKAGQINKINSNDNFYLPSPATATTTAYVPDKLNRYGTVGGQAMTYDASGNMLTWFPVGGKHTYTYDSENRLRTAAVNGSATASITYDYDALGRRLSKVITGQPSTYFLLDGDEEIAEYNSSGTVLRRYITGPAIDDRIARVEGSGLTNPTKYYYHSNHQGSVIDMTDSAGNITQQLAYDEYGNLTSTPPAVGTGEVFRYTGRRFDVETGLYYYRARFYAPVLGRFLQTDSIGYGADLNLYAYVSNDAANKTDPSGNCHLGTYICPKAKAGESKPPGDTGASNQPGNQGGGAAWAGGGGGMGGGGASEHWEQAAASTNVTTPNSSAASAANHRKLDSRAQAPGPGNGSSRAATATVAATATAATAATAVNTSNTVTSSATQATRAFWVGESSGLVAAQASGSQVLQLTPAAQAALNAGNPALMFGESAAWAQGATGASAEAYIGNGVGYTFWNYEFPQLLENVTVGTLGRILIIF